MRWILIFMMRFNREGWFQDLKNNGILQIGLEFHFFIFILKGFLYEKPEARPHPANKASISRIGSIILGMSIYCDPTFVVDIESLRVAWRKIGKEN